MIKKGNNIMEDDDFFCPNCGKVSPSTIWYTFPTSFKCPTCGNIFDKKQDMPVLSDDDARKVRPEFYKDKLWEACNEFIKHNQISCPETIHQCDWVNENSYEFIEKICEIVGYYKGGE
jgi:DNA-directed RNA polymerase subunit RPC12/RpoP